MSIEHGIGWDDPRIGVPIKPIPSSAWIDPIGKFYAVPDCGHVRWAEQQFGTWELEDRGWVHLSFGTLMYNIIRQSQIDTLYDALNAYREAGYRYTEDLARNLQRVLDNFEG